MAVVLGLEGAMLGVLERADRYQVVKRARARADLWAIWSGTIRWFATLQVRSNGAYGMRIKRMRFSLINVIMTALFTWMFLQCLTTMMSTSKWEKARKARSHFRSEPARAQTAALKWRKAERQDHSH